MIFEFFGLGTGRPHDQKETSCLYKTLANGVEEPAGKRATKSVHLNTMWEHLGYSATKMCRQFYLAILPSKKGLSIKLSILHKSLPLNPLKLVSLGLLASPVDRANLKYP